METTFGSPFNWCDRRCDRCPLAGSCPVSRCEGQHPPDDDDDCPLCAALEDADVFEIDLEEALADADADVDDRKDPLESYVLAVVELLGGVAPGGPSEPVEEIFRSAVLLCDKLNDFEDEHAHGEVGPIDAVPNLLLIEAVELSIADEIERIGVSDPERLRAFHEAREALLRRLAPQLEKIPRSARDELSLLCATGVAPSPFCTIATRRPVPSGESSPMLRQLSN